VDNSVEKLWIRGKLWISGGKLWISCGCGSHLENFSCYNSNLRKNSSEIREIFPGKYNITILQYLPIDFLYKKIDFLYIKTLIFYNNET